MPQTIRDITGDGVTANLLDIAIAVPDSGTLFALAGRIQALGQPLQTISGTVNSPGVPGSGTNYWIIAVDSTTGTPAAYTSTVSLAACSAQMTATQLQVYSESIPAGASANPQLDGPVGLSDSW